MATHDRGEALRLSDRIAVMNDGMIVQVGSPKEVMNRPVDEFIAAFVGMETILKGAVKESGGMGAFIMYVSSSDRTDSQAIEAVGNIPAGDEVVIVVRPENVTLTLPADDSGRTSARNVFTVRIAKIIKMGLYLKVSFDCGFPLSSFVTLHALEQLKLQEGSAVVASFKAMAVQVVRSNKPVDTAALRT